MITTIHGDMDEAFLEKKTGVVDNDNEYTTWVEYWQLVHRSAHVTIKRPAVFANTDIGGFGG